MRKAGFTGLALSFALSLLSISGNAQILLNELVVNPSGADDGCEYIELIGQPGAAVENIAFLSLEGDTNKGQATFVITVGSPGPVIGSNGILVFTGTIAPCSARTFPAGTTRIALPALDGPPAGGVLQNGTNSFLLISSTTAIAPGTDLDTNDDGTLDGLPAGAVILDSLAFSDGGATDVIYGPLLTAVGGTVGAATRFVGDNRPNLAAAWYGGALTGTPDSTTYSATIRTINFPANGALTPGAPNVGTAVRDAVVDLNGDGRTDYVVLRPAGGVGSQLTWFTQFNGGSPYSTRDWGINGDQFFAGDYDSDGVDDIAVFRPSNGTFYIILTATQTIRIDQFGQTGDEARIVGDYDGDGRDDIAVYRAGTQSTWFYKTSSNSPLFAVNWGQTGDAPAPGDYDGDARADFVVQRADGANGRFFKRLATGAQSSELFGLATDEVVPGDYDGDGKTDICVVRTVSGFRVWDFEPSGTAGSTVVSDPWGVPTDIIAQGDYNGDGRTDYAVWRPGSPGTFFVMTPVDRNIFSKDWGQTGDLPAASYNTF